MNLTKGFDRLVLAFSILFIIPMFYVVFPDCKDSLKTKNPEYIVYKKQYKLKKDELQKKVDTFTKKEFQEEISKIRATQTQHSFFNMTYTNEPKKYYVEWHLNKIHVPKKYIEPPLYQTIPLSLVFSVIVSSILFLLLKSVIRSIRWIVLGFKD